MSVMHVVLLAVSTHGAPEAPLRTDVFVAGKDGYHTYRIPSLLVTARGTLLAFCEGRKTGRSDHGDIDLLIKRSGDGGRTWSEQAIVHEEGGAAKVTIGNPCPVVDRTSGAIWLPFCRDNDRVFVTKSDDDGRTWSAPREITDSVKKPGWGWYATGPGVGIQLRGGSHPGRLLIPCDHREKVGGEWVKMSHAFYSDDHGRSWKLGASVDAHTDECQAVELADGSVVMNMRNYWGRSGNRKDRGGKRAVAVSRDGGATWSDLRFDEALIEPVCQASFLRYTLPDRGGRDRIVFSNPASPTERHKLTVRLSHDGAATWPISRVLHAGPAAYSCLAVLPDLSLGCLYEGGEYEKLIFARFTLEWLSAGSDHLAVDGK